MKFLPVAPDKSISGFVNKFIIVSSGPEFSNSFYSEVVPTGFNYFNIGEAEKVLYHHPDRCVELTSGCYVNGHLKSSRVNVEARGPFTFINCEMHATGLYYLFDQPAHQFTDRYLPLEEVIGEEEARRYTNRWQARESDEESIAIITEFIQERVQGKKADHYVDDSIRLILDNKGKITVEELSNAAGVSRRQLEKKFRIMAGVSPGYYSGMIQFMNALKMLENDPTLPLQDLAYEAGYYDLPHLMNSFRKFSGAWPSEYSMLQKKYIEEVIK